jgi:hypothetical protein
VSECRRVLDSFSAVTRIALNPLTGHSCWQTPQPMQRSGSITGFCRRTSMTACAPAAGDSAQDAEEAMVIESAEFSAIRRSSFSGALSGRMK